METLSTRDLQQRLEELKALETELNEAREEYEGLMDKESTEEEEAEALSRLSYAEEALSEEDEQLGEETNNDRT